MAQLHSVLQGSLPGRACRLCPPRTQACPVVLREVPALLPLQSLHLLHPQAASERRGQICRAAQILEVQTQVELGAQEQAPAFFYSGVSASSPSYV